MVGPHFLQSPTMLLLVPLFVRLDLIYLVIYLFDRQPIPGRKLGGSFCF